MKLTLAKLCSIIPFFMYVGLIPSVFFPVALMNMDGQKLLWGFLATPLLLYALLGWIPAGVLAVLGIVFSATSLISQHERKAIKFLVLSCVHAAIDTVWLLLVATLLIGLILFDTSVSCV